MRLNMLKGKGISSGIGIGKALVLKKEEIKITLSRKKVNMIRFGNLQFWDKKNLL